MSAPPSLTDVEEDADKMTLRTYSNSSAVPPTLFQKAAEILKCTECEAEARCTISSEFDRNMILWKHILSYPN